MRPNATSGNPGHTYRFYNGSYGTPAYSFGDGMSYTTFTQVCKDTHSHFGVAPCVRLHSFTCFVWPVCDCVRRVCLWRRRRCPRTPCRRS